MCILTVNCCVCKLEQSPVQSDISLLVSEIMNVVENYAPR